MRNIGRFTFPETEAEAANWKPLQVRHMLHRQVMVVARTRIEGAWKAYCFPVAGMNHDKEESEWKRDGLQLPESVARAIFGFLSEVPYAE